MSRLSHFFRELKSATVINRPPGCMFSQDNLMSELDAAKNCVESSLSSLLQIFFVSVIMF